MFHGLKTDRDSCEKGRWLRQAFPACRTSRRSQPATTHITDGTTVRFDLRGTPGIPARSCSLPGCEREFATYVGRARPKLLIRRGKTATRK